MKASDPKQVNFNYLSYGANSLRFVGLRYQNEGLENFLYTKSYKKKFSNKTILIIS